MRNWSRPPTPRSCGRNDSTDRSQQLAKVQDQVTQRIASALNMALVDAESQRALRERPNNPDAVDLTMRGMALINKPASRESMQRARELFEERCGLVPITFRP